jgi:hypothetical protein
MKQKIIDKWNELSFKKKGILVACVIIIVLAIALQ